MSKDVIRLGDPTSHGGAVVSVTARHFTVDGLPVARVGDRCTCPVKGHGVCVIAEGDPNFTIGGLPVALDGHRTSCGATLRSTARGFGRG
ncbi:PAAR domain-containing protein [Azohydromonas australica]|uniref:PAAR domain-containing protein n=1 Tax=Azohydromonas australica TaxID=364039 RepID=UPI00040AB356|nr:PAAR domain-containing protein [Azohydromonas australica]